MNGSRVLAGALSLCISTAGCNGLSKSQLGAGIGAAVGGAGGVLAGRALGGGRAGQIVGGLGGAVVGGVVGYQIAKMLDERDRNQHAAATEKALETGQGQVWKNPETGSSGSVEVVKETPAAETSTTSGATADQSAKPSAGAGASPASSGSSSAQATASARQCKTLRQAITLKDGTTREEEVTACKGPNGWEQDG